MLELIYDKLRCLFGHGEPEVIRTMDGDVIVCSRCRSKLGLGFVRVAEDPEITGTDHETAEG